MSAYSPPIAPEKYMQAFLQGQERGYDYFFRLYYRALLFYAGRLLNNDADAEDLVQDCFARLWQKRVQIRNPAAIRSFLYSTVRNACLSRLRHQKTQPLQTGLTEECELPDESPVEQEALLLQAELLRRVYEALEVLPARVKEVFTLFYIEGKNDHEISGLLSTSYHTIRNQRARALTLLKQRLQIAE